MTTISQALQPLFILSKLGLMFYKFNKDETSVQVRLYGVSKLFISALFVYSCVKVLAIFFIWPSTSINMISNINTFATSIYVIATFITTMNSNSTFNKLIHTVTYLDTDLEIPLKYNQKLRRLIYQLLLVIVLVYIGFLGDNIFNYTAMKHVALNLPWEMFFQKSMTLLIESINVVTIVVLVKMICFRFEHINQILHQLLVSKEMNSLVMLAKLRRLRPLHMKVGELVSIFNEAFGVNLLMLNAVFFTQFLLSGYLLIVSLGRDHDDKLLVFLALKGVYFVAYVFYMWAICNVCHQTELEQKKAGEILHAIDAIEDLPYYENMKDVNNELMVFSLQILNADLQFTAGDCFVVNCTLLFKMVGALVTYLIILMQFSG